MHASAMKNSVSASQAKVAAAASTFMISAAALAVGPQVIYTKIPTHASSIIPGALDLAGNPAVTNFRAMENLYLSPDGTRWVISARTQQGTDSETILLIGSGLSGTMFLQEGRPVPDGVAGELIDFFGSGVGEFDDNNNFALSLRARGGLATSMHKVIVYMGGLVPAPGDFTLVARGGNTPGVDLYTGLSDLAPAPSGDETIGNSIGSIHPLNDGRLGCQDSTINIIHTSRRPAIFYTPPVAPLGGLLTFNMFQQTGVTTFIDLDGITPRTWGTLSANTFYTTPDGNRWMAQGTILGAATTANDVLVVDGKAVLQENFPVGISTAVVFSIVNTELMSQGAWYSRGARSVAGVSNGVWAARNGVLVAQTGDGILSFGPTENWVSFLAFSGNNSGDFVLAGKTNNANLAIDDVVVVNGRVVLREGDPIDLNNNGAYDDNVFIGRGNNTLGAFEPNDCALTDGRILYLFANLRDGQGNDLNSNPAFVSPQSFLRLNVNLPCPTDIVQNGYVNVDDLLAVINSWGACPRPCPPRCAADVAPPGGNCFVNVDDLLAVINSWGPCPSEMRACCFPNGSCLVLNLANCTAQGGNSQVAEPLCTPGLCPILPANDECAGAFEVLEGVTVVDNSTATTSNVPQPICTNDLTRDVWLKYTATFTGPLSVSTCTTTGSVTDTVLAVYTGSCGNLVEYSCNDNGCDGGGKDAPNLYSHTIFSITAANVYWIRIASWGSSANNSGNVFCIIANFGGGGGGDSDGDRIPDSNELNTCSSVSPPLYGTNPFNPDTDGDGLNDGDEVYGTLGGLNLRALGCNPLIKDLLLEVDWIDDSTGGAHTHRPSATAVNDLINAFANAPVFNICGSIGIALHVDYNQGPPYTRGNLIPGNDTVVIFDTEYNAYKAANFNANRNGYFYYSIHAHRYDLVTNNSSGIAEINGDDHMVTLQNFLSNSDVSKTMMHEFGHNLGLRHGGFEDLNFKPNYNSVMNYRFQFPGVDFTCDAVGDGALDYSQGLRGPLDESSLNEALGMCGAPAIDWDGNSVIDPPFIARNINCSAGNSTACGLGSGACYDAICQILQDYNDWLFLMYTGLSDPDFAPQPKEIITCDAPRVTAGRR